MDPIFFLHIPKTAGTSLRLWLKQALPEVGCGDLFYPQDMAQVSDAELSKRTLIAGHHGISEVERAQDCIPGTRVLTMLRDPGGLAASLFSELFSTSDEDIEAHPHFDRLTASAVAAAREAGSLQRFMSREDGAGMVRDFQLRYLLPDGAPVLGWALPRARAERESDIETALGKLTSYAAFGIAAAPERSAALFCDALQWPWLGAFAKHNVKAGHTTVALLPPDWPDLDLYRCAASVFEQRWADLCARMGADPAAPDHGLRAVAEGLDRRALETLPAATSDWTGVEDGLFARGLGERFFYEPEQRWLRNMTSEMTVFAPCRAEARRLSLCFGYILPEPEKVSLCVNGMATAFDIRYEQEPGGAWRIWLDANLPADRRRAVVATVRSAPDVTAQGSFLGFASA